MPCQLHCAGASVQLLDDFFSRHLGDRLDLQNILAKRETKRLGRNEASALARRGRANAGTTRVVNSSRTPVAAYSFKAADRSKTVIPQTCRRAQERVGSVSCRIAIARSCLDRAVSGRSRTQRAILKRRQVADCLSSYATARRPQHACCVEPVLPVSNHPQRSTAWGGRGGGRWWRHSHARGKQRRGARACCAPH
jgi:hypothetical protein